MTLDELISELLTVKNELGGGVQVRLEADHGQSLMKPTWVGISYITDDEYIAEYISDAEADDYSPHSLRVTHIQAY